MRRRALQCPFCDNLLARPVDIEFKSMELTGGICTCGAVYAFDRSGHNLGETFMDALTFLCRGDVDKALTLNPDEYETEDFDYDLHANSLGDTRRKSKSSKILFARLKNQA
ncbi:MAG: hypothetical protein HY758_09365 [Nitrospirae bacterium]|nr:hypothetical protein [Nitrospirota bacterium]